MGAKTIDEMTEFAIEALLSGHDWRRRAVVRHLALRWPSVPALMLVFALTSAAALIEDSFGPEGGSDRVSTLGYKLAALLAADIFALEAMGRCPAKSRDLLHFWRRVDTYFLKL
jgi:hypothetical protein